MFKKFLQKNKIKKAVISEVNSLQEQRQQAIEALQALQKG